MISDSYGYIDLNTWSNIVLQAIHKIVQGVDDDVYINTAFENKNTTTDTVNEEMIFKIKNSNQVDEDDNNDSNESTIRNSSDTDCDDDDTLKMPKNKKHSTKSKMSKNKKSQDKNKHFSATTTTFVNPKMPSALQLQMRYDRNRYTAEKNKNNIASARCIAEKRFDNLRENDFYHDNTKNIAPSERYNEDSNGLKYQERQPYDNKSYTNFRYNDNSRYHTDRKDEATNKENQQKIQYQGYYKREGGCEVKPNYWRESDEKRPKPTLISRDNNNNNKNAVNKKNSIGVSGGGYKRGYSTQPDIGKENFLHSGKAALEIADSFLNGDLYCRLLDNGTASPMTRDIHNETMPSESDDEENTYFNYMESGGIRETRHPCSRLEKNMDRRTDIIHSETQKKSQKNSEERFSYVDGWRSAKGGWVGDFGPLHTHSLLQNTTVPKRSFQSNLPLYKQQHPQPDTCQDDMKKNNTMHKNTFNEKSEWGSFVNDSKDSNISVDNDDDEKEKKVSRDADKDSMSLLHFINVEDEEADAYFESKGETNK